MSHELGQSGLPTLCILSALNCEAKAIVDFLKLKKSTDKPFTTYQGVTEALGRRVDVCVLISGIGALNMSAAVGWLSAKKEAGKSVWLNVGIAGHSDYAVGEAFVVTSSRDVFSERTYYPPQVAKRFVKSCGCLSVNAPSGDYPEFGGLDMEAASFFKSASRFVAAEYVQSFKVVSDNPESNLNDLNAEKISSLMIDHTNSILEFANGLISLGASAPNLPELLMLPDVRATHSQKKRFENLALRACNTLELAELAGLKVQLCEARDFDHAYNLLDRALLRFEPALSQL